MKLSVATNFDNQLIEKIKDLPVTELYGKLPSDPIGGGRSSYMLDHISKRNFEKHVAFARTNGIGFNYLLNAACLDNIETTRKGQKQLRKILDWMSEIGVSSTTITNPLLLRTIKRSYPNLRVRISVFAGVDHIQKAKYWEDEGADVICLDGLAVNRDEKALRSIRQSVSCDLELLANGNCMASCSLAQTHMNLLAHSSQKGHASSGFVIDHCVLECAKKKLSEPVNYLRSDWIRPEDIHLYEDMGYHHFKLVERNLPTDLMVKRVKAYSERHYEGNLIDLVQPYGHTKKEGTSKYSAHNLVRPLSFLFKPAKVNLLKLTLLQKLTAKRGMLGGLEGVQPIQISNRDLDGFVEEILKKDCRHLDCNSCKYCHRMADKVVKIDSQYREECLELHKKTDDLIVSGKLWL